MFITLGDMTFRVEAIAVIKSAGVGMTNIWTWGQNATDGAFLVNIGYDQVMTSLDEVRFVSLAVAARDDNRSHSDA